MLKKLILIPAMLFVSIHAFAGGFEIPDNGTAALGRAGAFTAKADDPTAMYYNPAGLAFLRGWKLLIDSNLAWKHVSFTRAPDGNTTYPTVHNNAAPFPGPMLVLTSDFGLKDWTFAAGIYGPSAVGKTRYPDDSALKYPAVAPQKFELVSMDVMMAFYTLAAAWKPTDKFSLGVALQWADMWHSRFDVWVSAFTTTNKGGTRPNPEYDTRAHLDLDDRFAFTMLFGMKIKPDPAFEFGLSFRPIPVRFHTKGSVDVDFDTTKTLKDMASGGKLFLSKNNVSLDIELPIYVRMGARYIYRKHQRELFDIEFDAVYEHWSTTKAYNLNFDAAMSMNGQEYPLKPLSIPKNYNDTWSFRLGGDYNVLADKLWLRLGTYYETGAVPRSTTYLDFFSFDRVGVTAGLTWRIWIFDLKVAYEHIFQPTRNISVSETKIYENMPMSPCGSPYTSKECDPPGIPPGPAVGAGSYKASYDILSAGFTLNFDRLVHHGKK